MRAILNTIAAIVVAAGLYSCTLSTEPVPMTEMFHLCSQLQFPSPGGYVIRDSAEWRRYSTNDVTPAVDFSRVILIAVEWPLHSGCDDCVEAIESIAPTPHGFEVRVGTLPFLGECRIIVQPRQVVMLPRVDLPVIFTGEVPKAQ